MSSPGACVPPRLPVEDSYLELLADTLESLDLSARGQFLQHYIRAITHLDLRESQCIQLWDDMLLRRRELSENLGRQVALKTASKESCGSEDVHQGGFQRDLAAKVVTQLASTQEHIVPELNALALKQIEVSDGTNVVLQELSARG